MTFFLSRDLSGSSACHQSRPTSRSWLRAAIELSSLKSIRDVAKVRKKVPSGKWTVRVSKVPVSGDQPRQWSLHSPRMSYLWSCSGTAAGRCRWGPADGRRSAETAWPRPPHCPEPSCWRWAGKGKTRNHGLDKPNEVRDLLSYLFRVPAFTCTNPRMECLIVIFIHEMKYSNH